MNVELIIGKMLILSETLECKHVRIVFLVIKMFGKEEYTSKEENK